MTTQTYIPDSKTLEELGFKLVDHGYYQCYENGFLAFYYNLNEWQFERQGLFTPIYPKDKAHLQSIILAFQQN